MHVDRAPGGCNVAGMKSNDADPVTTHARLLEQARYFLKDHIRQEVDFSQTDQHRGIPPPPIQKPFPSDAFRMPLPPRPSGEAPFTEVRLADAINGRESRRRFSPAPLSLAELGFLLWATQGVREILHPAAALRTVPSAGARHALETYLCVRQAEKLTSGIYRYLPVEHELLHVADVPDLGARLTQAVLGQAFAGHAAVTFAWTAIPYRMEWRYGLASHKVIALDAGHVCQNLYLACEAVGAGTCAIAAYDQNTMDELLGVDGRDEFTVYLAPVGKV